MSDLETPEADMMRDHSSLDAAPATLRPEESQPGLDPNNPGAAPDTTLDLMAGHPLWRTMTSVELDVITCANTASNRAAASVRRQQVAEMVYNVHRFFRLSPFTVPHLSRRTVCEARSRRGRPS